MNGIGALQGGGGGGVEIVLPPSLDFPEEGCCQKILRIALKIIFVALVVSAIVQVAALFTVAPVAGAHLGVAVGLFAAAFFCGRAVKQASLSDPDQRAEVLTEAAGTPFKELLDTYSLQRIRDYQLLPEDELKVKALRYLEEASLNHERVSAGLLDGFVDAEFISEGIRELLSTNAYPSELKHILFAQRLQAEVASDRFGRAQPFVNADIVINRPAPDLG